MDFCESESLTWTELCYHIESELDIWKNKKHKLKRKVWKDKHYSCVDAVKLLNGGRIVVSGSRDRTLALWDAVKGTDEPIAHCITAHTGWIWDLAAHDDSLYSCSWDSSIKLWRYDPLREISTFICTGSVLSVACRSQLVAAGLFNTGIILFDPRCQDSVGEYSPHRLAITALALSGDNYLVSASEDRTIAVWDLRTYKPVTNNITVSCNKSFPMSMYYNNNLLYIGDNQSYLHIISINNGVFKKRGYFHLDAKPHHKLTSVWHGTGCIMVGSTDKSVKIYAPTQPPELISELNERTGEVATIDYCSPVLAIGCTDNSIEVWQTEDAFC
ncbi:F-box/WD repeat-containing protein 9-like isoform X2 [Lycorma delicatula]